MEHPSQFNVLFESLEHYGQEGRIAVSYLRAHRTKISFKHARPSTGAWWTIAGNINLNSRYHSFDNMLNDTRAFTLLIHEVRHLQQGFFTALSVYGELDAWQLEWNVYHRMHNRYPNSAIQELMSLPLGWDRAVLRRAVQLMQTYATKGYRADLLPLYPLGKEIAYLLFRKVPSSTLQTV